MGRIYKGYELYKMIADRKIKKDSKFRDNNGQIWTWNEFNFIAERNYSDFVFSIMDFELLEDEEIDIQEIEEFNRPNLHINNFSDVEKEVGWIYEAYNENLRAVKQLDNKIKEK